MKTRKEFLEAVMKMGNLKDLKQADEVPQESKKRYHTLFKESRDAIL
jgi:hypothetical protein